MNAKGRESEIELRVGPDAADSLAAVRRGALKSAIANSPTSGMIQAVKSLGGASNPGSFWKPKIIELGLASAKKQQGNCQGGVLRHNLTQSDE